MGAAALTGRLPRRRSRAAARDTAAETAPSFDAPGGPLVAVCGLVGGAGATTLAYLLAQRAARHSTAPVLLAELQQQAGLAALSGVGSPLGLRQLAHAVADEQPVERPFAELEGGLRLVASARPVAGEPADPAALAQVLADAREAHGLVVLDTGPLGGAPETAVLLEAASHVLFVLPITHAALRQAELLADSCALTKAGCSAVTLVAVATRPGRGAPHKQLRRLAGRHADRLLLVPHSAELAANQHCPGDAVLEDTMAALATILRTAQ